MSQLISRSFQHLSELARDLTVELVVDTELPTHQRVVPWRSRKRIVLEVLRDGVWQNDQDLQACIG